MTQSGGVGVHTTESPEGGHGRLCKCKGSNELDHIQSCTIAMELPIGLDPVAREMEKTEYVPRVCPGCIGLW